MIGFSNWSLRVRLVACLAGVLAVTLGLGCVLVGWHAAASVRTEMQSSLDVGRSAVRNGIAGTSTLPEMRQLVATFDGNRHVRAVLSDAQGATLAISRPQPSARHVPAWFARAIAPSLPPVVVSVPTGGAITLVAHPVNEISEVWDQATDAARTLAVFFALTVMLIHWVVGRALRPLARLSVAFGQIGAGDYSARMHAAGPPELVVLAAGFNRMAGQLGAMAMQNDQLQEQLLTLQEEERAELARDLHDEVGPLLFATHIDASALPALMTGGCIAEAGARVDAIRESVGRIQSHIRAILGRLRPLAFGTVGLAEAIGNLVAFWRNRHPHIEFVLLVQVAHEALDEPLRATICRVVQESLCNAVRHGQPDRIEISVTEADATISVRVTDDGVGTPSGVISPGHGLTGMGERVRAQSGSLAISGQSGGRGLVVTARLPCEAAA